MPGYPRRVVRTWSGGKYLVHPVRQDFPALVSTPMLLARDPAHFLQGRVLARLLALDDSLSRLRGLPIGLTQLT